MQKKFCLEQHCMPRSREIRNPSGYSQWHGRPKFLYVRLSWPEIICLPSGGLVAVLGQSCEHRKSTERPVWRHMALDILFSLYGEITLLNRTWIFWLSVGFQLFQWKIKRKVWSKEARKQGRKEGKKELVLNLKREKKLWTSWLILKWKCKLLG